MGGENKNRNTFVGGFDGAAWGFGASLVLNQRAINQIHKRGENKMKTVRSIVSNELKGASTVYLEDIARHGIHNTINKFNDENYHEYQKEFKAQARELLEDLEWGDA